MASMGIASILHKASLFVLALLPCTVTGTELAINSHTADYQLTTKPGLDESLRCTVQDGSQQEELLWLRGDGKVALQEGNKVNASSICVSPVTIEDNGVSFTCQLARNGSVQISVVLDVIFPPILDGEDPASAQEGDDVTLNCHARANPLADVTWHKDNSNLTVEVSRYQFSSNSKLFQLVIQGVQKSDSGKYTCKVESTLGTRSWDFHLDVEDRKLPFPTEAVIAATVVVALTVLFAIVARRERIFKCFRKASKSPNNTAL